MPEHAPSVAAGTLLLSLYHSQSEILSMFVLHFYSLFTLIHTWDFHMLFHTFLEI